MIKGFEVRIYAGGSAMSGETSSSVSLSCNMEEVASENGGWQSCLPDTLTAGFKAKMTIDAAGWAKLWTCYKDSSTLRYSIDFGQDSETSIDGNCIITSLKESAPLKGKITCDIALKIVNTPTVMTHE